MKGNDRINRNGGKKDIGGKIERYWREDNVSDNEAKTNFAKLAGG